MAFSEPKTIIFAPNIRSGGGLVLLKPLLQHCIGKEKYFLILHNDMRKHLENVPSNVKFFRGDLRSRLAAEVYVWRLADLNDKIFCFHSLPSLIGLRRNCFIYFHNLNMLAPGILYRNDKWNFLRSSIEGLILRALTYRIKMVYCQSTSVVNMLKKRTLLDSGRLIVAPFADIPKYQKHEQNENSRSFKLIYPADGAPHKNHNNLFAAASILESKIPNLNIFVTLEEKVYERLQNKYPNKVILNKGTCNHHDVLAMMSKCDALIFPSFTESLGLPIIEARSLGMSIIGPEMDYVRNICQPVETFDPNSPLSISRAVLRFFHLSDCSERNIMSSKAFLQNVLDK